jgi:hypothetical protein
MAAAARLRIAPDLALPLEAVTETIAILGIRGSGKTNTAVVMTEELLKQGQQVLIVDPTDVWWGLKSSKDGERPGFPVVILGGKHADLPLAERDGATVADFVVDEHVPTILSLRHFESKSAQRRFVTDLARRLYFRKGESGNDTPLMVIIDEASLFVPQRVGAAEAEMVGAIQQLVRQGRSSGFGVTLIDQRPATVNKDVLTQLELLVAHRISSPQDRKAIEAWVEQHDTEDVGETFLSSIASLPQGTAWFWSPGWLNVFSKAAVRERSTYDSSRTPKPGEILVTPKKVADVDLIALKTKLAATIEKARADDPVALKKRIAELERATKNAATDPAAIDRAKEQGRHEAALRHEHLMRQMRAKLSSIVADVRSVHDAAESLNALLVPEPTASAAAQRPTPPRGPARPASSRPPSSPASRARASAPRGDLSKGQQKIVNALAELEAIDVFAPGRAQLGMFAGYNLTGGTGAQHIADLVSMGLVEIPGAGAVQLTDAGRAAADAIEPPSDINELHLRMLSKLSAGQRKILEHLLEIYPTPISRAELGAAAGYNLTGGTGAQHVADLVTLGAAKIPQAGRVVASDILFPAALS